MKKMQKLISLTLTGILLFTAMQPVFGGEFDPFAFDLGLEGYYFQYREKNLDHSLLMKETGPVFGILFAAELAPCPESLKARLETRIAKTYFIHYSSPESGSLSNSRFWLNETRAMLAYPFILSEYCHIEPYAGLGFRYLHNDDRGRKTNQGYYAYLRTSRYHYVPIGVQMTNPINCDYMVKSYVEYDYFINGKQKSYLSWFGRITVNNRQHNGFGARVGVDFLKRDCDDDFYYFVGVFVRHWNIGKSRFKMVNSRQHGREWWFEPKNSTYEVGLRIGATF